MASEINDGTKLEELVQLIEGIGLPPDFAMEKRRKIYNEAGVQVAELDITIAGRVGTIPYSMLIECRDRPSEGAAGADWIEQLVGRRDRFGFDTVVAVSTTGFSPGACEFAKAKGIITRTLAALTVDEVASWLPFNAPLVIRNGQFSAVRMGLEIDDNSIDGRREPILKDEKRFTHRSTKQRSSLLEIWNRVLQSDESLFAGLDVGDPPREQRVVVREELAREYDLTIDLGTFPLTDLEFDATFWIDRPVMPLAYAGQYRAEDGHLFTIAKWDGKPTDAIRQLVVILTPKTETQS